MVLALRKPGRESRHLSSFLPVFLFFVFARRETERRTRIKSETEENKKKEDEGTEKKVRKGGEEETRNWRNHREQTTHHEFSHGRCCSLI